MSSPASVGPRILSKHPSAPSSYAPQPDAVLRSKVMADHQRKSVLHKKVTIDLLQSIRDSENLVRTINFSSDGTAFLAGGEDRKLRLYSVTTQTPNGICVQNSRMHPSLTFELPSTGCLMASFLPNHRNKIIVAPSNPKAPDIFCLDASTQALCSTYHVEQDGVDPTATDCADVEPCATLVVHPTHSPGIFCTGRDNHCVSFFSVSVSKPIAKLAEPSQGKPIVAWHPDGNLIAVVDEQQHLLLYDFRYLHQNDGGLLGRFELSRFTNDNCHDLVFHPTATATLLLTTTDCGLVQINLAKGGDDRTTTLTEKNHDRAAWQEIIATRHQSFMEDRRHIPCGARYSPDGKLIAVGTVATHVVLFHAASLRTACISQQHYTCAVTAVAWNPRFQFFAAATNECGWFSVTHDDDSNS